MNLKSTKEFSTQHRHHSNGAGKDKFDHRGFALPRSPYLSSEKLQVISHGLIEKRMFPAEFDSKRGRNICLEEPCQPKRKKMKKSVLTLPTATCDPPQCPQYNYGGSACNKLKNNTKASRVLKNRVRHAKPTPMGDKLTTDSELNSKIGDEEFKTPQRNIKKGEQCLDTSMNLFGNPTCVLSGTMTPEKQLSSHDVWNILREMNKRQYNRTTQKISDDSTIFDIRQKTRKHYKRRSKARVTEARRKQETDYFSRVELNNMNNNVISNESSLRCVTVVDIGVKRNKDSNRNQYVGEWMCNNVNRLANERVHRYDKMTEEIKCNIDINNTTAVTNDVPTIRGTQIFKKSGQTDFTQDNKGKDLQLFSTGTKVTKNIMKNSNIYQYAANKFTKEVSQNKKYQSAASRNIKSINSVKITCPNIKYPVVILGNDVCAPVRVHEYTAPQFANMRGIWRYMIGWSTNYENDNVKPNKYLKLLSRQNTTLIKSQKYPTARIQRKLMQRSSFRKKDNAKNRKENKIDELQVLFQNVNDFNTSTVRLNERRNANIKIRLPEKPKTLKNRAPILKNKFEPAPSLSNACTSSPDNKKAIIEFDIDNTKKDPETAKNITDTKSAKQNTLKSYNRLTTSKEAVNAKVQETLSRLESNRFYDYENWADNTVARFKESIFRQNANQKNNHSETIYSSKPEPLKDTGNEECVYFRGKSDKKKSSLISRKEIIKKYFIEPLISSHTSPTTIIQKTLADSVESEELVYGVLQYLESHSRIDKVKENFPAECKKDFIPKYNNRWTKSKEALNAKIETVLNNTFYDYDDWAQKTLLKSKKFPFRQRWTLGSRRKRMFHHLETKDTSKMEPPKPSQSFGSAFIKRKSSGENEMKIITRKSRKKLARKSLIHLLSSPNTHLLKPSNNNICARLENRRTTAVIPGFNECPPKVYLKVLGRNELVVEIPMKNIVVYFEMTEKSLAMDELEETFSLSLMDVQTTQRYKANHKLSFATLPEQICTLWPILSKILEKCSVAITENTNTSDIGIAIEDVLNNTIPKNKINCGHNNCFPKGKLNPKLHSMLRKKMKPVAPCWKKPVPYLSETKELLHDMNYQFIKDCAMFNDRVRNLKSDVSSDWSEPEVLQVGTQNLLGAVKCYYTPWYENQSDSSWIIRHWINEFISALARTIKLKPQPCMNSMVRLHQMNVQLLTFSLSEKVIQRFLLLISSDNFHLLFCRNSRNFEIAKAGSIEENSIRQKCKGEEEYTSLKCKKNHFSTSKIRSAFSNFPVKIKNRWKIKYKILENFRKQNPGRIKAKRKETKVKNEESFPVHDVTNLKDFMAVLGGAGLSEAIDEELAKRILTALLEFAVWSKSISPVQALLMLLLLSKPETQCLYKFRRGLVQGIATGRISNSSDLEHECRLVELDAEVESVTEGDDGHIVEELYDIAKTTALEHERPFNEDSERTLHSLVRRQRRLNPSYLRVMAKYVGLGLFTSPSRENLKLVHN